MDASRIAALEAELAVDRWKAVSALRAAEEAMARQVLGLGAGDLVDAVRAVASERTDEARAAAIHHLAAAEGWQWEIGTWASGSGEGLASMFEVRTLQLAQAWLHGAAPDGTAEALRLADEVQGDPNRVAARYDAAVEALRGRLSITPRSPRR